MTFWIRGMIWVWQCSPSSIMIQRLPILCATAPVVPDPAKESRTRSLGFVAISNMRRISFSGLGVANESSGFIALTSSRASWLFPASVCSQIVAGGVPEIFNSLKKVFREGFAFPSVPNQISSFSSNLRRVSAGNLGEVPLGGIHTNPFLNWNENACSFSEPVRFA